MNKLLRRLLKKHFGKGGEVTPGLTGLLHVISESYDHYEKDRKDIVRSIELSSKERIELNSQLKKEKKHLKKTHNALKTLFENINEVLYSVDMVSYKLIQISAVCKKVYGYTAAEFHSDKDLWQKVIAYATALKQLFQNLVTNAIKFRKKEVVPRINISVKTQEHYWQFTFKDSGIGIEKKNQEKILIFSTPAHAGKIGRFGYRIISL